MIQMDEKKIISELFKELESKEFRYGKMPSVKHGVNISDCKRILRKAIQKTKQQMFKEVELKFIDSEEGHWLLNKVDWKLLKDSK